MYRAAAWGGALITTGLFPNRIAAPVLVGVAGVGRPLIDVAGRTLLQRVVPDRVLSRVFGVLEGLYAAGLALGLAVIPALFALIGVRATFVISGAFLPLLFLLVSRRLSEIDAASAVPEAQIALLRRLPIFVPLPAPTIERVASRLIPTEVAVGTAIVRGGDPGDRFYIIADGARLLCPKKAATWLRSVLATSSVRSPRSATSPVPRPSPRARACNSTPSSATTSWKP